MDKKIFGIGILSLSAVILLAANFVIRQPAEAVAVIKDRDYQAATVKGPTGGDSLYVADNRTGVIAIFSYDPTSRGLKLRASRLVADAFVQK
jgi:hypothetical protein